MNGTFPIFKTRVRMQIRTILTLTIYALLHLKALHNQNQLSVAKTTSDEIAIILYGYAREEIVGL